MQEFTRKLTKPFSQGLFPTRVAQTNALFLESASNVIPRPEGLRACESITQFNLVATNHETDRLIQCSIDVLHATSNNILKTNGTVPLTTIDIDSGEIENITPGLSWHFAEFGPTYVLTNGTDIVLKLNVTDLIDSNEVAVKKNAMINTCCAHRGRAIFAGFSPEEFFGNNWNEILLRGDNSKFDAAFSGLDKNFVFWTSIGMDLAPLFIDTMAVAGTADSSEYTVEDSYILEMFRKNQFGFMPMPFSGNIHKVLPLEKSVVVYGTNGIVMMPAVNSGEISTYGLTYLLSIGIGGRDCAGGNDSQHLFIDQDAKLWSISKEGLKLLDYSAHLANLDLTKTSISFDPINNYFYISDGSLAYVYTESGLGTTNKLVSSCAVIDGGLIALYNEATETDHNITIVPFDFDTRDFKTITSIEVIGNYTNGLIGCSAYYDGVWKTIPNIRLNPKGFGRLQVTATMIKLFFTCDETTDFSIDYINLHYQMSSAHIRRGTYANTAGQQGDF